MDDRAKAQALLEEAARMPDSALKVRTCEEAARLADLCNDEEMAFRARERLVRAASDCGEPESMLVAFAWLLAACDRNPEKFPERGQMWYYKWAINQVSNFPQISRERIEAAFEDMTQRYTRCGLSLRAVYHLRETTARDMADDAAAEHWRGLWVNARRDGSQDCAACERDYETKYLTRRGALDEALALAQPILSGQMRCASVPERTLARFACQLARAGRAEEAADMARRALVHLDFDASSLSSMGQILEAMGSCGEREAGLRLLERTLRFSISGGSPHSRFWYLYGARALLAAVASRSNTGVRKLRFTREHPQYQSSGEYSLAALVAWADAELNAIAAAFDARNGNNGYARDLAKLRSAKP